VPRVVHFEIHADDPERAAAFYQAVFGWEIVRWGGPVDYWLITTGPDEEPGINGGILRRQGPGPDEEATPMAAFVCTADVPSLDGTIAAVGAAGGAVAVPRMAIPGVGHLAYFRDTEGNVFGAMEADEQAA
jgi:predicted enzyme related to lactoylglutathione lyase